MRRRGTPRVSIPRFFCRDPDDDLCRPDFFLDRNLCRLLRCPLAKPEEQPAVSDCPCLRTGFARSLDRQPYYGLRSCGVVTGVQCECGGIVTVTVRHGKAKTARPKDGASASPESNALDGNPHSRNCHGT